MKVYVHRTPYTVHRTPYTVHRTPYSVHRTPYTVQCTVYGSETPLSAQHRFVLGVITTNVEGARRSGLGTGRGVVGVVRGVA